jgi:hypothetical protein
MNAAPSGYAQVPRTVFTVPSSAIGAVIGKGGAKINEIRSYTGAQVRGLLPVGHGGAHVCGCVQIQVSQQDNGTGMREIFVSGTPEQQMWVKYLVNLRVQEHQQQVWREWRVVVSVQQMMSLTRFVTHQNSSQYRGAAAGGADRV